MTWPTKRQGQRQIQWQRRWQWVMRANLETCDLRLEPWDTDYISDNWEHCDPWIKSDGDSIRNSCNVSSYEATPLGQQKQEAEKWYLRRRDRGMWGWGGLGRWQGEEKEEEMEKMHVELMGLVDQRTPLYWLFDSCPISLSRYDFTGRELRGWTN